ncbi:MULTISPECIES: AAA family ATPase [unclassified Agrococcus]|uniref:AAA family ATPase n=1 Tax=unclassified Agrococcus TaxID=2615065 RepID=UPI003619720A
MARSVKAPSLGDLPRTPKALRKRMERRLAPKETPAHPKEASGPLTARQRAYVEAGVEAEVRRLAAMRYATTGTPDEYRGEPWDATCHAVACRLIELGNATGDGERYRERFEAEAPTDAGFSERTVAAKWASAARTVGDRPASVPEHVEPSTPTTLPLDAPAAAPLDLACIDPRLADPELAALVLSAVQGQDIRDLAGLVRAARDGVGRPTWEASTLDEVLALPTEARWRVEGLLPSLGRLLLIAQRKVGKTTWTMNLLRSLLLGEPFLGRFDVTPLSGSVLLLNFEVDAATQGRWLADVGLDDPALASRVVVVNVRGVENPLATDAGRRRLAAVMRERDVEAVVVDPFGRAFTGIEQSNNSEVTAWLSALDRVVTEGGASELVLVAHAGWGDAKGQSQTRVRGASALEDWADSIVRYWKDRNDDDAPRFMEAEGRDVAMPADRLDFDPSTRRLTLTGTGGQRAARSLKRASFLEEPILDLVRLSPGATASQIEASLRQRGNSFSKGDEGHALRSLEEAGLIVRRKDGRTMRHYLPDAAPPPRGVLPLDLSTESPTTKEKNS